MYFDLPAKKRKKRKKQSLEKKKIGLKTSQKPSAFADF